MSTVFEPVSSGKFVAKNGKSTGNGTGAAAKREIVPPGLNAEKVISKRYSLKDENGNPVETWKALRRGFRHGRAHPQGQRLLVSGRHRRARGGR